MSKAERKGDESGLAEEVEIIEDIENYKPVDASNKHDASGTVKLFNKTSVNLIPAPTADPKDPLNLPTWRKNIIIFLVGMYSAISVLGTSGMGSIKTQVLAMYPDESEARVDELLTYPTLFMGIGNLLSVPMSVCIGRRPVFLLSLVVMILSGVWCAVSTSLTSHIAGRNFFSMAAGQSEALAPLIVQEIHFMHEHGAKLSYFVAVQTAGTAVGFLATTYIASNIGVRWWYGIMTVVNGLNLLLSIFFATETLFDRQGLAAARIDPPGSRTLAGSSATKHGQVLDPEQYGPRTWRHDLQLFHGRFDWKATALFYKHTLQGLFIPTIFWLLLLNGACLGVYIYQASTFATILMSPPYSFQPTWLGYVQVVQVLDCVISVPLLGYGSDFISKMLSKRHDGVFQPEYRLITVILPAACVVISCVLYGYAGASPADWSWMAVVAPYHLGFFAFLGVNLVGITYAIDSFPERTAPLLLVICAGRGFISFGLSYSTVPITNRLGYDGSMNIFAIVTGVLAGLGIPAYFFGGWVRRFVTRRMWPASADGHS